MENGPIRWCLILYSVCSFKQIFKTDMVFGGVAILTRSFKLPFGAFNLFVVSRRCRILYSEAYLNLCVTSVRCINKRIVYYYYYYYYYLLFLVVCLRIGLAAHWSVTTTTTTMNSGGGT
jgi:hypothetical protein